MASLVAGTYMDRSLADFQRACEVHIGEEQRKPNPDTALIAVLCDAVRCARELSAVATGRDAVSVDAPVLLRALARRLADRLGSHLRTEAELPPLHASIERELVALWNQRGAADRAALATVLIGDATRADTAVSLVLRVAADAARAALVALDRS